MISRVISYGKQWIDNEDIEDIVSVLKSEHLTQGPTVSKFEEQICNYTGAKYAIAVSSATAALHIAVMAFEIEAGKEGITSPNTFVASANCLAYCGLKPIFADINPVTFNIDPMRIEEKINCNTRVLIPVHFAGRPAEMEKIYDIARRNNLYIIEDAAHAIGSGYKNGMKVGACCYSDMTVFSFHPVKTITTGEGGVITTNNKELYKKLLLLRSHGITKDIESLSQNPGPWYYEMVGLGYNYRMSDIQAALGSSQLKKLDSFVSRRREIVKLYNEAFKNLSYASIPDESDVESTAFHLYVLKIDFNKIGICRKEFMELLYKKYIGSQVHYIPVHTQPYYQKNYGYKLNDFPIAEEYYNRALSIPLFPQMSDEEVQHVIYNIISLLQGV